MYPSFLYISFVDKKKQYTLCIFAKRAEKSTKDQYSHKAQSQTQTAVANTTFEKLNVESDSITKGVKAPQANTIHFVCVPERSLRVSVPDVKYVWMNLSLPNGVFDLRSLLERDSLGSERAMWMSIDSTIVRCDALCHSFLITDLFLLFRIFFV